MIFPVPRYLIVLCALLFCLVPGQAHPDDWFLESEAGTDGNGIPFFSQYAFWQDGGLNGFGRYFYVEGVKNRGEFGFGPRFGRHALRNVQLQLGGTTDRDVMLAGIVMATPLGRGLIYIGDLKLSTTERSNTLYQKLFWNFNSVNSDRTVQIRFRIEDLVVGTQHAFLRIGAETDIHFDHKPPFFHLAHVFVAPFYDPIIRKPGIQAGLRFLP